VGGRTRKNRFAPRARWHRASVGAAKIFCIDSRAFRGSRFFEGEASPASSHPQNPMRHLTKIVLSGLTLPTLFCSSLHAQRLAAYTPAVGAIAELQPPVPMLPAAVPPVAVYPQVPAMPVIAAPAGDATFDNRAGYTWVTNGALMVAQPTPTFPPVVPVPPPFPIPAAVIAMIGGGPVTGIAYDVVGGIMWLTSAPGITIGCAPVAGMPVIVPAFPLAFLTGPITGLEWDAMTGTLIACDAAGVVYTYFPGGFPAAPPILPPGILPGMATDVAIDRTLRLNGFGLRPLYMVAGPGYYDVNAPLGPFVPTGPVPAQGLAFINHPAANPPVGTCLCPGTGFPTQATPGPMTAGNGAWGLGVGGLPPGWPVLFAFDFAFLPGFPLVNAVGCGLGLTALPIVIAVAADPAGNATLPLSLTPPVLPLGAGPFYNQNFTLCPADPVLGLVLTPTQSVYVSSF